jgi:hypothetical protein
LSFSAIARDARVLRHVNVARQLGDVITCGFGPRPDGVAEHIEVPTSYSLPQTPAGVALLAARRLTRAERAAPALQSALRLLAGQTFDVIVCNEARALPVAFDVADGAPVWADMHEWAPQERSHDWRWRLLVAPLATHTCRRYLPRAAAVTTVGQAIADLYTSTFGVECSVLRNAAPYVDLEPSPPEPGSIRVVHSGGAVPGRNIEMLIDAVAQLGDPFRLDLYLVPANDRGVYLRQLEERAAKADGVRLLAPVSPNELPYVLNGYDVGAYSIPPINVNTTYALPNKFFDFVQARLALAIGPSVEMVRLTRDHDLGVVADDFGEDSFVRTLASLTPESVARYKQHAHAAAHELSSEREEQLTTDLIRRLLRVG